jgi:osmotically-inducible protein OsmY
MLDDERIEMKSQQAIADDTELMENTYVNITSYNGVVLITGEATLPVYKQRVEKLVKEQTKVRIVRNELQIAPLSDSASRRNDTVITARLKSRLIRADNVDSSNIKVVSESATVYLMGLVTPEEGDQVVDVARKTEGVARIVKVFEYKK